MKRQLTLQETKVVISQLESFFEDSKKRWLQENPRIKSWFGIHHENLIHDAKFMIKITDELILFVENLIPNGPDKKIAVLYVISKLFDFIAATTFPIWLKPFTAIIKEIIVSIIITQLIDFMVDKYNAGFWETQIQAGG